MGRAARRAPQIVCISVQEARRASTLQHRRVRCGGCCGCGRMACLLSFSTLVCHRIFGAYASCPMCTRPPCAAGWSAVVMVSGKARGVQNVCTGSPGEQCRGILPAHVEYVSRAVACDRKNVVRTVAWIDWDDLVLLGVLRALVSVCWLRY